MTSAPASSSPFDGVVEFFTLSRASAQLGRLGESGRKQVAATLALGRQRGEAAETLWSNGHTAEGLRLAFAALDATLDAASTFADALKLDQPAAAPAPKAAAAEPPKEEPKKEESAEKPADATAAEGETVSEAKAEAAEAEPAASEPTPEPKKDVAAATDAASIAAALRESIESLPPAPPERWRAALASRGMRAAKIDQIGATLVAKRDAKLPDLDADVSPALADLFQRVMDARHAVDAAVGTGAWTSGDMRWARVRRWLGASVLLAGAIGGSYFALHEPEGVFASASDVWQQNASFSADMAIDGRNDTWWILPDRATGWVEERISPSRHVSQVVLLNSSNPPSHDRGTSDYRLEIYSGGTLARSIDGHFDWADSPQPVTHDIDMDGVERVRFVVRSYHRTGGGLTEMTVR